jgi:hypothetical protein
MKDYKGVYMYVCEALIDISQGLFLPCLASEATPRGADGRLMRQLKHDTAIRCDRNRRATENPWGFASFFGIGGFEMWLCTYIISLGINLAMSCN